MSREISVNYRVTFTKGSLTDTLIDSFVLDMANAGGPSPGEVLVPTTGVSIAISPPLIQPLWASFKNLGRAAGSGDLATDYLEIGIQDPTDNRYFPFAELQLGWSFPVPLTRNLGQYWGGTGTGTFPGPKLFAKAHGATLKLVLKAYEA